jgi:hypothetical protein
MRERARALSDRLTAAPHPDGGFEVRAELPSRTAMMFHDDVVVVMVACARVTR